MTLTFVCICVYKDSKYVLYSLYDVLLRFALPLNVRFQAWIVTRVQLIQMYLHALVHVQFLDCVVN